MLKTSTMAIFIRGVRALQPADFRIILGTPTRSITRSMIFLKLYIPILFVVFASGCSNLSGIPDPALDTGYRVTLHKPLTVVPEVTRVFLQAGEPWNSRPPTINEIRYALGGLASISF